MKGRYRFGNVKKAQYRRLEIWSQKGWPENMAALLTLRASRTIPKNRYFRWFDAGDIQSLKMLKSIVGIADYVPQVGFYLPTQERKYVADYLRKFEEFPKNLVVRVSSTKIGQVQRSPTGLSSVVLESDASCPARFQENTCGECRWCWEPEVEIISYPLH